MPELSYTTLRDYCVHATKVSMTYLIDLNFVSRLILVKTLDIYIPYIREPITALFFNGSLAQWTEHQTSNLMMMVRFHQESLVF